ncbi:MAG: hypothetical protein LAN62_05915 [Acidobacteriia bacterium]|nr:hypothetical protein [Terriglobia bacterium]
MTSDKSEETGLVRHWSLRLCNSSAEWVRDKEAANLCDYFAPNPTLYARGNRPTSKADDAKKKFDSLFNT